jgi:hypothetical protein
VDEASDRGHRLKKVNAMKTIADKNRFETELRFAPSNIRHSERTKKTVNWTVLVILCIVALWFVTGIAEVVIASVKFSHLLTAIIALRWLFVRTSIIKTVILIIIITAIFN